MPDNQVEIANLRLEYIKLGSALADLHSSFNSGDLSQMDYDVIYFSYCLIMAKIKRSIFEISPKAVNSL